MRPRPRRESQPEFLGGLLMNVSRIVSLDVRLTAAGSLNRTGDRDGDMGGEGIGDWDGRRMGGAWRNPQSWGEPPEQTTQVVADQTRSHFPSLLPQHVDPFPLCLRCSTHLRLVWLSLGETLVIY